MADSEDNLLDLSGWPAPPPATAQPPRQGLPARPVRSRRLPRPPGNLHGSAIVVVVLGLTLLLVPAGKCGSAVGAWAASGAPLPPDTPPQLDDAQLARDAEAVRAAQAALTARTSASPSPAPQATASQRGTVSRVSPDVAAAAAAVDAGQRDVDTAKGELDRLLAEQEASSDPAAYDGQVAAAQEELNRAVATLDDARRYLATARSRTARVAVSTTPGPRPTTAASAAPGRAALLARLAGARTEQAANLAAREKAVSDWRANLQAETARVGTHNAQVRACAERAGVPGSLGLGLVALGSGVLLWRRFGHSAASRP